MRTVMYLLRHAATEANLARPARLQGRHNDPPLAPLGIRQAQATRDFLAVRPVDHCYSSPLRRALETAQIVAAPHGLTPVPLPELIECDLGRWEGLDWQTIRRDEPEMYEQFQTDPAAHGYPGGESLADVSARAGAVLGELLERHEGEAILVVAHHVVNRSYLAGLLGLPAALARQVTLDNCGISVVVRAGGDTSISTLNAAFHLQGVAA